MPGTALIVIDMLNSYEHADADKLTRSVERALAEVAKAADVRLRAEAAP